VSEAKPRLAFFSPLFLFPNDAGGKIRTTNILRGLKGGAFKLRLLSPATAQQCQEWSAEIESVCDEFVPWQPARAKPRALRALDLIGQLPVNVASDVSEAASRAAQAQAAGGDVDLMVFDFVHASVYRPQPLRVKSVCFTHNVEAEIFQRHAATARGPLRRWLWHSQHAKMQRFEGEALRQYDQVIAVSERDARHFVSAYGVARAEAIPTGVDLDYFSWGQPAPDAAEPPGVVFVGSMDSAANIGAVEYFLRDVWPLILAAEPQARFTVVGRRPPAALVAQGRRTANVEFTGSVPDVRPFVRKAHVSVIPLQVGGGTRIKAFESMAMGSPVVSTSVGIEGLDVEPREHFLQADDARAMADAVLGLLRDPAARAGLAQRARALVEARFGHREAAQVFERICQRALAG
jgi:polysaccharide biosynthesis protein PslH